MNKEELQNNYIEMLILDLEKHSFDYWESTQDEMVEALRKLQQENKILRKNSEHNDKVVDKVNWENRLLKQQNQKYKEVIDKAINNSQYWIDYYTRLNSDERIALRLQENIDILKESGD